MNALTAYPFQGFDADLLPQNEAVLLDVLQAFAEIEDGDPRLMVIVASARIGTAVDQAIKGLGRGITLTDCLHDRMSLAKKLNIVDRDFLAYADAIYSVRDVIVQTPTRAAWYKSSECLPHILRACGYSASVPVWPQVIDPQDDMQKGVFATCVAGVLAAEMDFFEPCGAAIPKGFEALAEWAYSASDCDGGGERWI